MSRQTCLMGPDTFIFCYVLNLLTCSSVFFPWHRCTILLSHMWNMRWECVLLSVIHKGSNISSGGQIISCFCLRISCRCLSSLGPTHSFQDKEQSTTKLVLLQKAKKGNHKTTKQFSQTGVHGNESRITCLSFASVPLPSNFLSSFLFNETI